MAIEKEIERKWLVNKAIADTMPYNHVIDIEQAYLVSEKDIAVRIRKVGNEYKMTAKSGQGLERLETTNMISGVAGEALCKSCKHLIVKKRKVIDFWDDDTKKSYTVELDIFDKWLDGLAVAEIEFDSVEDALAFKNIPTWFGKEVTKDSRYQNSNLAVTQIRPHSATHNMSYEG